MTSSEQTCPRCGVYSVDGRLCVSCEGLFLRTGINRPSPFKAPVLDPPTAVRTFASGATRDTDQGKLDYEAFLSPLVLERYARYMHFNRHQSDGTLRDGDNWQKGLPMEAYQKSLWRHMMAAWTRWRGWDQTDLQEHLCGVLFNTMGLLHELVKAEQPKQQASTKEEEQHG